MTPLRHAFPTLHAKNVPVPPPSAHGGWWHAGSDAGGGPPRVDPTWSGQADNLIAHGASAETSHHYPAGGVRPGNNEPEFLTRRFVPTEGGARLALPRQQPQAFGAVPYDTDPLGFNHG